MPLEGAVADRLMRLPIERRGHAVSQRATVAQTARRLLRYSAAVWMFGCILNAGLDGIARARGPALVRIESTEPHMGTQVRLVVYAADQARARPAIRAAFDRIAALDRTLTDYQSTSELMQLSARAGQGPVRISDDLYRVLDAAQTLARQSRGAFDVTSGPSTRLWRRARRLSEMPAAARVTEAHALTGYRRLHLDAHARTAALEQPGMSLDVGGLAKGFAADEAIAVLTSYGLTRALVALGGDIAVSGPPPEHEGWTIEIASLDAPGAPRPQALVLQHAAVSTAGDAEQWLPANGIRYSHILDPRTGWPMTIRSSTTVIARRGLDADALDTALAVLGPDEGLPLVEAHPGAAALLIRQGQDGDVTMHPSRRWTTRGRPGSAPSVTAPSVAGLSPPRPTGQSNAFSELTRCASRYDRSWGSSAAQSPPAVCS